MPRMLFEKTGSSVWISHLDLMRVFQRAFRRAGLLLKHSQGFTPRAIVSIALPLSVGMESQCELLDFELEDVRGLYINLKYDGQKLQCITGTAMNLFTMDKSLEQAWDVMVQRFFTQKEIKYEVL